MRFLPLNDAQRQEMLYAIGVKGQDAFFKTLAGYENNISSFDLSKTKSEKEVESILTKLANKNIDTTKMSSFLGGGLYNHHIPAAVDYLIQRGEFMTAYTPYQPEVSQGTLQMLFEFQTQLSRLTGMDVANASMYDGATAMAEAVMMARRFNKRDHVLLSGNIHPQYTEVTQTYLGLQHIKADILAVNPNAPEAIDKMIQTITEQTSCVVVQCPDFFGHIQDYQKLADACHAKNALFIMVFTEPLALGLLPAFNKMGADIVVGEGSSLGMGLNFGGPGLGLFACRQDYLRQMPGRLCGETIDQNGKKGYVLTLAAREQHIRREKATSNICTNAGLCALAFSIHVAMLGETGFKKLARLNHHYATLLALKLSKIKGVKILNTSYFNEFTISLPIAAVEFCQKMEEYAIFAGVPVSRFMPSYKNELIVAITEMNEIDDIEAYGKATQEVLS